MRLWFSLGIAALGHTLLPAQEHPNVRHMERAHPTPIVVDHGPVPMVPMIPFVEQTTFPSLFGNTSMVVNESDPLPAQNESSIAINPLNPLNVIGSAVDYRGSSSTLAYYTLDGGATWENVTLGTALPGWASSNDPSVAFDREGRGYLCYGGFNRTGNAQFGENGVFVSVTTDGGQTWDPKHVPVILHTGPQTADSSFEDKYYVHVDTATASPFHNRLYIPWKRVVNADSSTQIVIASSSDHGRTWTTPVPVSARFSRTSEDTTFGQSFPLARTGPDGSVHVVWNSGTERAIRYARSTDGGVTFTEPRLLHRYTSFGIKSTIGGQTNSRVKGTVRAEAYPTLVADATNGPRRGWLYLVWSADTVPNIYFSRSTDNGTTWSAPVVVHSDTTNDQFWPWIALDPTNGDLGVMYFDSRDDAANILVNCYVSYSSDGGTTWKDRRAGDGENDLRKNPFAGNTFAGDYSGCDFYDGIIRPSWVDMRNTVSNPADNDVYTARVHVRAPRAPETFTAATLADTATAIRCTWSPVTERSFGQPLAAGDLRYQLYRDGVLLTTLPGGTHTYLDQGLTPFTRYAYELVVTAGDDQASPRRASAYAGGSRFPGKPTILTVTDGENLQPTITMEMPRRRDDALTPLVNLASVKLYADDVVTTATAERSDTGRVISRTITVPHRGWYRFSVTALDANGNEGIMSDTITAYVGPYRYPSPLTFDDQPRFLTLSGDWGRIQGFATSMPYSFTDSPNGPYRPSQRDTVILHPFVADHGDGMHSVFTARVAAFVDPTDTAYLDVWEHRSQAWTTVTTWNAGMVDRWMDTTKGDDAWRFVHYPLPVRNGDTVMLRLRMRTNARAQSDGVYLDDIAITTSVTSVDTEIDPVLGVYPQPASMHSVIGLRSERPVDRLRVLAVDGTTVSTPWYQDGRSVVVDVRLLPSGMYVVAFDQGAATARLPIQVVR